MHAQQAAIQRRSARRIDLLTSRVQRCLDFSIGLVLAQRVGRPDSCRNPSDHRDLKEQANDSGEGPADRKELEPGQQDGEEQAHGNVSNTTKSESIQEAGPPVQRRSPRCSIPPKKWGLRRPVESGRPAKADIAGEPVQDGQLEEFLDDEEHLGLHYCFRRRPSWTFPNAPLQPGHEKLLLSSIFGAVLAIR